MSIKATLHTRATEVESWLTTCLKTDSSIPVGLRSAMEYSLLAGGKRIRPVLCLASAELFGLTTSQVLPFACAIECIHTYSLIHDDLPAMDNDDLRRGKPSNHKQFDEATAILAGDALLTDAFAFMASLADCTDSTPTNTGINPSFILAAIAEVALAAGSAGMVGGQFLDMAYTNQQGIHFESLRTMHSMKTGALLTAPCVCGAILAGASPKDVAHMRAYGAHLGAAFQIIDDILDITGTEEELGKPVGSDAEMTKTTYPHLLGVEQSFAYAKDTIDSAIQHIAHYKAPASDFLCELARYMLKRVS